jgi:hypothetical protein
VQKCLHQSGEDLSPIQINSIKTTLAEGLFANPNATIGHLAALSACDLSHLTSKKLAEFIERCINRRATEDAAADKLKQKIIDNSDIDASTEPMGQEAQLVMPALPNPEDASINQSADQSATNNTTADKLDHTAKLNYEVEMIFFHFDQFASMPIALADAEVTKRLLILFRNNRLLWGKMMDRIDRELPVFGFNSATAHSWLC